ncbi:MAG: hypothetical protein MHMPM18_003652, partial [Marteilia pararefringens]
MSKENYVDFMQKILEEILLLDPNKNLLMATGLVLNKGIDLKKYNFHPHIPIRGVKDMENLRKHLLSRTNLIYLYHQNIDIFKFLFHQSAKINQAVTVSKAFQ